MNNQETEKTVFDENPNTQETKVRKWKKPWIKRFIFVLIANSIYYIAVPYFNPTLHRAVQKNNLEKIKELHKKGRDLNALDSDGWAPIHCAIMNTSTDAIELLLKLGATIDVKTKKKKLNPLMLAVLNQKKSHVKLLLKHDAQVNFEAMQGASALRLAVEKNDLEIAELLLQNNAKIEIYAPDGLNILHYAIQANRPTMVELLLKYSSNIEAPAKLEVDTPPLHLAAFYGHEKIAALFIKYGSNVNQMVCNDKNEISPLHIAAEKGNAVVGVLLEKSAKTESVTKEGFTPLHLAVINNNFESVKLLIKHKADINAIAKEKFVHTPLSIAIEKGNAQMVSLLISLGADTTIPLVKNISNLAYAALKGNLEICEILIKHGSDVNKPASHNIIPLHHAIFGENQNIVALFLKNNASIEAYNDTDGMNALHIAVAHNEIEMAKLILDKGADVNVLSKGHKKATPLHYAVVCGNIEMASLLIAHGAQVSKPGYKEVPLLTASAATGNIEMANLLLKHGASINKAATSDCITALHIAVSYKKKGMITFLIENGAKIDVEAPSGKSVLDIAKETKNEDIINLVKNNIALQYSSHDEKC
jgi:ankyrin repeat protein